MSILIEAFTKGWSQYVPCDNPDAMGGHHYNYYSSSPLVLPDLYLFNSKQLSAVDKQRLTKAFFTHTRVWQCFRSLRFVDGGHEDAEDVAPVRDNKQFLAIHHSSLFTAMRKSHDYILWMQPHTYVCIHLSSTTLQAILCANCMVMMFIANPCQLVMVDSSCNSA